MTKPDVVLHNIRFLCLDTTHIPHRISHRLRRWEVHLQIVIKIGPIQQPYAATAKQAHNTVSA